jgi:Flp pilus assembly protein TadB
MIPWLAVALFGVCFAGVAWYFAAGVKIKSGWQNGQSPLARWLDERRRNKFNDQLPEALATMSNALRAGFSISQAFDSVVAQGEKPMCEEFAILQQQLRIGMSFEDALESMSGRVGSDDLTLVTTAILISRKTGGNVNLCFTSWRTADESAADSSRKSAASVSGGAASILLGRKRLRTFGQGAHASASFGRCGTTGASCHCGRYD